MPETGSPNLDFDRIIDRIATNSVAVDGFRDYLFDGEPITLPCRDEDVVAMWVADMAFAVAPPVLEAMRQRLEQPIFGYTVPLGGALTDAFTEWCQRRYGWAPDPAHHVCAPGVVPALYDLVSFVLSPGDKALTFTPAYEPFELAVAHHGCELVACDLHRAEGGHGFDPAELASKLADPTVRLFILCHPHNPTGRSWSDSDLRSIAELCFERDVMIISDEIHCDLLRVGRTHTPLAKLYPHSDQIITCMSSTKTFNLAGLGLANIVIPNDRIRTRWEDRHFPVVNPVSAAAATAAFNRGDEWLTQLRHYLDANFELVESALAERLPDARFEIPDATYLAWIDLAAYFPRGTNLTRHYAERTGVLIEGGEKFIANADRCIRMNLACPRSMLADALDRIVGATPTP